jgi:hypothetical protein
MKKHILSVLSALLLTSFLATAQKVLSVADEVVGSGSISNARKGSVTEDKTETSDITGIGASTFSTSNTFDGTTKSYKHNLKITLELLTSAGKASTYQLVFYSPDDQQLFAANSNAGVNYIYYPISFYEGIKLKLEQSLAARKKIQVKVTFKKDGFREGVLIL